MTISILHQRYVITITEVALRLIIVYVDLHSMDQNVMFSTAMEPYITRVLCAVPMEVVSYLIIARAKQDTMEQDARHTAVLALFIIQV